MDGKEDVNALQSNWLASGHALLNPMGYTCRVYAKFDTPPDQWTGGPCHRTLLRRVPRLTGPPTLALRVYLTRMLHIIPGYSSLVGEDAADHHGAQCCALDQTIGLTPCVPLFGANVTSPSGSMQARMITTDTSVE